MEVESLPMDSSCLSNANMLFSQFASESTIKKNDDCHLQHHGERNVIYVGPLAIPTCVTNTIDTSGIEVLDVNQKEEAPIRSDVDVIVTNSETKQPNGMVEEQKGGMVEERESPTKEQKQKESPEKGLFSPNYKIKGAKAGILVTSYNLVPPKNKQNITPIALEDRLKARLLMIDHLDQKFQVRYYLHDMLRITVDNDKECICLFDSVTDVLTHNDLKNAFASVQDKNNEVVVFTVKNIQQRWQELWFQHNFHDHPSIDVYNRFFCEEFLKNEALKAEWTVTSETIELMKKATIKKNNLNVASERIKTVYANNDAQKEAAQAMLEMKRHVELDPKSLDVMMMKRVCKTIGCVKAREEFKDLFGKRECLFIELNALRELPEEQIAKFDSYFQYVTKRENEIQRYTDEMTDILLFRNDEEEEDLVAIEHEKKKEDVRKAVIELHNNQFLLEDAKEKQVAAFELSERPNHKKILSEKCQKTRDSLVKNHNETHEKVKEYLTLCCFTEVNLGDFKLDSKLRDAIEYVGEEDFEVDKTTQECRAKKEAAVKEDVEDEMQQVYDRKQKEMEEDREREERHRQRKQQAEKREKNVQELKEELKTSGFINDNVNDDASKRKSAFSRIHDEALAVMPNKKPRIEELANPKLMKEIEETHKELEELEEHVTKKMLTVDTNKLAKYVDAETLLQLSKGKDKTTLPQSTWLTYVRNSKTPEERAEAAKKGNETRAKNKALNAITKTYVATQSTTQFRTIPADTLIKTKPVEKAPKVKDDWRLINALRKEQEEKEKAEQERKIRKALMEQQKKEEKEAYLKQLEEKYASDEEIEEIEAEPFDSNNKSIIAFNLVPEPQPQTKEELLIRLEEYNVEIGFLEEAYEKRKKEPMDAETRSKFINESFKDIVTLKNKRSKFVLEHNL